MVDSSVEIGDRRRRSSVEDFLAAAVDAGKSAGRCNSLWVLRDEKGGAQRRGKILAYFDLLIYFIGEETTAAFGTTELTDEPTWIVDPLYGTANFVHGYFYVPISSCKLVFLISIGVYVYLNTLFLAQIRKHGFGKVYVQYEGGWRVASLLSHPVC
ncbi:hypothetical protein MIMGU_mgv1a025122mg [Erythranthe guttata]|uniref:Uncharacterized protein n=1 Tax=Erythranthe guttata TaxID=4155 RepID=A0A022QIB7_ERYGU|nr:hypothetical protein MIMGU_mgv1a025122mg [Erythranthe guttata]